MKVLVSDKLSEQGIAVLKKEPDIEVDVLTDLSKEELLEKIGEYEGLVVRSATKVTADVIDAGKKLRVIGRAGVGVDNIDVERATQRGIVVINAPEGNTISAAEHTLAMMMALSRKIPQAYVSMVRERKWERSKFMGVQLAGKTLGVIGLGRIGTEVAKRALAMDMRVLAYDPYVSEERAKKLGVELADVDRICRESDFITVHTPLTKATEHLISEREFSLMKPGVRIINVARGGIIDEKALYDAIVAGKVAGAALDVLEHEPAVDSPLLDLDCVIATPHLGASTEEAQINVAVDVAAEMIKALRGEPFKNAVNAPSFRPELMESLKPYMVLAEKLGKLYTELTGGAGHRKVEISYSGELIDQDVSPLTASALKGMLTPILHSDVNIVNAMMLARSRDIKVVESKQDENVGGFGSLITIRNMGEDGTHKVAGSLNSNGKPLIVLIDDYRVNVIPVGCMLVAYHQDKPGIIGKVGTILGNHEINVACMQVGRKTVSGDAVMVMGIDNGISEEALEQIRSIPDLKEVKIIEW